ncbi:MAG TPA: 50S ribosomal protein L25/general stress protein Ctc [Marinilabiliaceae bacterium]|nr:50S ribosomal protein L25/general stress protein Ctc [Marinilabiliaceae bacterium]
MKTIEIKAFKRKDLGKKATQELRKQGNVPSVLYGGEEIVHFYTSRIDFGKLLYTADVHLIDLNVEGKTYKAIIKELQFHPVTDEVIHVDLLQVFEDKPVVMEIPVKLKGLAKGVKAGGKLSLELRKLRVKALVKDLPNELVIDITNLGIGKTIQVGSLDYPNLEILNTKHAVVVAVKVARAAVVEEDEEEEVEGAEGEEAAAEGTEETKQEEQN